MPAMITLNALMRAAREGDMTCLEEFIAAGGDVRAETDNDRNAIVIAAENARTEFVRRLLDAGADPRAKDMHGSPLLSAAAGAGSLDVVRLLLDRNPNLRYVNGTDKVKETALHAAARRGHPDVVKLLLERRAKVNLQNKVGATPLLHAAYSSAREGQGAAYYEVVQHLLTHGANVIQDNDEGDTPLHIAARRNRGDIVRLFIEAGADPDLAAGGAKGDGKTPLHYAIEQGAMDSIQALADAGANMNIVLNNGTPLHFASRIVNTVDVGSVIAQLAVHGADPDVPCFYAGFANFRDYARSRPILAQALDAGLAKRAMAKVFASVRQRHLPNAAV